MRAVERRGGVGWRPLLLAVALWIPQAFAADATLAGRDVDVAFVDAATLETRPGPDRAWRVDVQSVALRAGVSPTDVLVANRIVPDSEAFTLVYELNPSVLDVNLLGAGATLVVPRLIGPDGKPLDPGVGVMLQLTLDAGIRRALIARIDELQRTGSTFADSRPDRFQSPAQSAKAKEQVAVLLKWFAQVRTRFIRRTAPPLRRDSLVQLRDEAAALQALLRGTEGDASTFSDADAERLAGMFDDVRLEMQKFSQALANQAPKAEPQYAVRVNINGADAPMIASLRVYYTINGLFQDPPTDPPVPTYAFRQLGSGMSEKLPVKNYRIWAARDGEPGRPASPPLLVRVSPSQGDMQVDLSVAAPTAR